LIKDGAIMVARRYWHLGRSSNDGRRDAWHGLSGSASAAFVCRLQLADQGPPGTGDTSSAQNT
jgi:hypothetical protein